MHFLNQKVFHLKVRIYSGNDLAPNRRQAITQTNADAGHWRICASWDPNESTNDQWYALVNIFINRDSVHDSNIVSKGPLQCNFL